LMAIAMTVPMVAVMLYRGHSRRSAGEMAAAMIAPTLPFVALKIDHLDQRTRRRPLHGRVGGRDGRVSVYRPREGWRAHLGPQTRMPAPEAFPLLNRSS